MAITKVKAPDGSVLKIKHPEGASNNEILRNAEILFYQKDQDAEDFQKNVRQRIRSNRAEFDPDSKAFQDKYGPASHGFLSNLAAGSGKALSDLMRGGQQLAVEGANLIPGVDLDEEAQQLRAQQTDRRALDAPLMRTAGGLTGNIGTNVGLAVAPGGLARGGGSALSLGLQAFSNPQTLRAAVTSGGIQGALQPVAEDELRSVNAGIGALAGGAGSLVARPFANSADDAARRAIDTLQDSGIPLDVAERTQSEAAKRVAAMLDDSIVSGGSREAFKGGQLRQFTRAVLRTIGQDADEATPAVMRDARRTIGSVFNDIAGQSDGIRADAVFYNNIANTYQEAQSQLLDDELRLFDRNFRNIIGSISNGRLSASQFNAAISKLSGLSTRPNVGRFAASLEHALLDALERANPAQRAALRAARGQWRNMRIIQGAVGKGEERFISPLRLSNALTNKRNQNLSVFGLGQDTSQDLSNLARAGREILGDFANSGTPLRQQLPTAGLVGASFAAGGPVGAAGAIGGIRGLSGAMNNQGLLGNLLTEGAPGLLSAPLTQALIQQGLRYQENQLQP